MKKRFLFSLFIGLLIILLPTLAHADLEDETTFINEAGEELGEVTAAEEKKEDVTRAVDTRMLIYIVAGIFVVVMGTMRWYRNRHKNRK